MNIDKIKSMLGFGDSIILKDIDYNENEINIHMELKKVYQTCPVCGEKVHKIHDYYTQKIRDLDIFENKTFIILKKRRYKCDCGKVFLEENEIMSKSQRMTKRFFHKILTKLKTEHSFTSVGRDLDISVNTVIRAFDKMEYPKADLKDVEVISIDEFKGNTGGEKYNCIIADPKGRKVLDILLRRNKSDLQGYFFDINKTERDKVKIFISDMWKTYFDVSKDRFRNSKFIVDKYHWIRQVIWAFEKVRKEEQGNICKEEKKYFKRSKSLLAKRLEYLTDAEKEEVNVMLNKNKCIKVAYLLKEEFLKILECKNKREAKKKLSKWILSAQGSSLKVFEKYANTVMNWSEGILNSFASSYTNGFIEGCNNKIKVLKRNAYGYSNFRRFRNRILHMFQDKKIKLN